MTRALGVDLGTRRVGLAVGDPSGMIASPVGIAQVRNMEQAVAAVKAKAAEFGCALIVVGFARNMNGTLGPKAKECRVFAEKLKAEGFAVELADERLTTVQAERSLIAADVSRKQRKEKLDAVAAQMILQGFLDRRGRKI